MPYYYDVKIDLVRQFNFFMKNQLEEMGVIKGIKLEDSCFQYLNLRKKTIQEFPRKILVAQEFQCPKHLLKGLELVSEKIRKGQDITPHLSKFIKNIDYHDLMLNDWGVHHLHLGTELDKKGFINRTGPVLFARFEKETAFFIQIMEHGEWANEELVKILHNNWPEAIDNYLLKGVLNLSHTINNEQRLKLRSSGYVVPVQVKENVIYGPIGGGYQSTGHNTQAISQCMRARNNLRRMEQDVREKISSFVDIIKSETNYYGNQFVFLFEMHEDNKVYIYETQSKCSIYLGNLF